MIALDTNLLVYTRREEVPQHAQARTMLEGLATGDAPWALPWPCVYEFLRVITHPRVFDPPTDFSRALEDLESLFASPSLFMLGEGPAHAGHLRRMVEGGRTTGNLVHDAHIAMRLRWSMACARSGRSTVTLYGFPASGHAIPCPLREALVHGSSASLSEAIVDPLVVLTVAGS